MSDLVKNMSAFDSFIRLKYKEGVWWNYGKPTHPLYADLWEAWQARVPEGYVVVPKEPSEEVITRVSDCIFDNFDTTKQHVRNCAIKTYKTAIGE